MQYFGYLHRNPNDGPEPTLDFQGYNFWLNKLNGFNGNFIDAEMVKAFISSDEYRRRFGSWEIEWGHRPHQARYAGRASLSQEQIG